MLQEFSSSNLTDVNDMPAGGMDNRTKDRQSRGVEGTHQK